VKALAPQDAGRLPFSNETTSLEAAMDPRARAGAASQIVRIRALMLARGHYGLTHEEIANATRIGIRQVSTRVRRLVLEGLARDTGRTRTGTSGRAARVWEPFDGPPLTKEKQTHGRIAAAVRETWRKAAAMTREKVFGESVESFTVLTGLAEAFEAKAKHLTEGGTDGE